jgi:hypothetical protein
MSELLKQHIIIFCIAQCLSAGLAGAQDSTTAETKTGWTYGVLPSVSYNTDLGFQYGGLVNLYHYGDGSRYPEYDHSIYLEISRTTKGSGINRLYYDSDRLVHGVRTTVDMSYLTEQALDFYGFNGYEARYNLEWEDDGHPAYRSRLYYRHARRMIRFKADVIGDLRGEAWKWMAGVAYYNFNIFSVDIDRLNKNKDEEDMLPDTAGLYDEYVDWGIIPDNAATGGSNFYLKLGLMYDTRDERANPMRGIWTEAAIRVAPSFLGNRDYGHAQVGITHRQYFTIIPEDLSFTYRLGYQGTIGTAPWYIAPVMMTSFLTSSSSQGLGGAKTLRGIVRHRIVGAGFVYGNFEFRWKFLHGRLFRQNLYIALNTFIDAGTTVQDVAVDRSLVPEAQRALYFDQDNDSIHPSYGGGIRFALNRNFIVAMDYGRTFDRRDGISGFYINLNYLY